MVGLAAPCQHFPTPASSEVRTELAAELYASTAYYCSVCTPGHVGGGGGGAADVVVVTESLS